MALSVTGLDLSSKTVTFSGILRQAVHKFTYCSHGCERTGPEELGHKQEVTGM